MKNYKKIILSVSSALLSLNSLSQTNPQLINQLPNSGGESFWCGPQNIPDAALNTNQRLVHVLQGTYGNPWSTWSAIGRPNIGWAPKPSNYYGYFVNNTSDRMFVGLRGVSQVANDRADSSNAVIAWGDDDNRLIFEFHSNNTNTTCDSYINEVATMTYNGRVGIGTSQANLPTARFHVNLNNNLSGTALANGIRFEGLPTANYSDVVIIDANGNLAKKVFVSGITNSCATINYIPKTSSINGNVSCSQIFDNGISVGIGTSTGFAYTWTGGLTGSALPPTSGNVKLNVNGVTKALAYFATSDARFKKDIKVLSGAINLINKIEGKTYYWRTDEYKDKGFVSSKQYGFIAQEIEKVIPEMVATDENGFKSVSYDMMIPVLTQAIKEQQKQIEENGKQIEELKNLVKLISSSNTTLNNKNIELSDKNIIVLNQNTPNPFADNTIIKYNIDKEFSKAQINFYDSQSKFIKSVEINQRGNGQITVFANDLNSGVYTYSLVVDGEVVFTKKMIKQ